MQFTHQCIITLAITAIKITLFVEDYFLIIMKILTIYNLINYQSVTPWFILIQLVIISNQVIEFIQDTKQNIPIVTFLLLRWCLILMNSERLALSGSTDLSLPYFLRILCSNITLPWGPVLTSSQSSSLKPLFDLIIWGNIKEIKVRIQTKSLEVIIIPNNTCSHLLDKIIILSSMDSSNSDLQLHIHSWHYWAVSAHILLNLLPTTHITANAKYLGAHMTSQELQHLGVGGVVLVPKMCREFILVGRYPIMCLVINTWVSLKWV